MTTDPPCLNIQPRRHVLAMAGYGAPDEGRYGKARLDFNENTEGFPAIAPTGVPWELVNAYPEYGECVGALASHFGLAPEQVLLTNGSDEGLCVIAQTFIEPGEDRAVISTPTFSMIPHYLNLSGANLVEVPVTKDLTFDLVAIEAQLLQGMKVAMFASPDNPTGATLGPKTVKDWCRRFPQTVFVLDEAYVEYSGDSLLPHLNEYPNLLITRTFSKAWGLAGLRLGVVLGHPQMVAWLARVRSPYSVNALATWTLRHLLPRAEAVVHQAKEAMNKKSALIEAIESRGYRVTHGAAHFFLVHAGVEAQRFAAFCEERRVLIRNRSHQVWPSEHPLWGALRINVGTKAENSALLDCFDVYRAQTGLLFDLDDTLVDTSKSFDATVALLVGRYSDQPLAPGELTALRAEGGFNDDWDATRELLKRRGVSIEREAIAEEGTAIYLSLAPQNETLMVDPLIFEALSRRYRLFVVTGRYRAEYDLIWGSRLDPCFERVYCRDDISTARPKPAPDLLSEALKAHQILQGYYIGNSVDDMTAAIAAGLSAVGVTHTQPAEKLLKAGAHHLVTQVEDLRKVFLP